MLNRLNRFIAGVFAPKPPTETDSQGLHLLSAAAPAAKGSPASVLPPVQVLTPPTDPKVSNKQQTQASYSKRTKTATGNQRLAEADRRTANLDILTLRNGQTTKSTIRALAAVSPDLSAAVWAYQRLVVTSGYTGVARNLDGTINPDATAALQRVIARFNFLTDYTDGFSSMASIGAVAESLTKELVLYGACSMELVLDKVRLPDRLVPISTTQISFFEDGTGYTYPQQRIAGNLIDLDVPTFFYEALDQDLLSAYSDSPIEAALSSALSDAEFNNDVRRVIKRALHPRLDAEINYESFRKNMPLEMHGDPEAARKYQDNFLTSIENTVNGLEPDDALVHFDSVKFDYLNNGNVTLNKEYETLQGMTNAKLATGTKAPPAVLGHGSASSNVASTETLLFMRYAGGIQNKVNSILSRAMTLSCRLMGYDVYVQFALDKIDLRPESELEAFRSMAQSRVLQLLSIGMLSDAEASLQLTGNLPAPGAPQLSGTMFMSPAAGAGGGGNPNSNTAQPQQSTFGQATKPDTPQQPKGPAKPGK